MASGTGEKTEHPTEKRLRESRRKGQVSKSQDLTSAVLLLAAVAVLALAGRHVGGALGALMADSLAHGAAFKGELDQTAALAALFKGVTAMAWALAPLFLALFTLAFLVNYLQVGSIFAIETMKPDMNKLNPVEGFKSKFLKPRPYIELAKTIVKIVITTFVIYSVLMKSRQDIVGLTRQQVPAVVFFVSGLVAEIGLKVGLAFLAIGAADYFLQKFLHLKELRMTKHEVKEEYKESEGNPIFKTARRRIHREILMQSMKAAVKKADVVVVNPTHVAVALKYERETMGAPTVVAKGADLMAAQIRRIAKEAGVPVMRDVGLARALYEIEVDDEIPEELYEAVAVVLRWVYQLAEERGEVERHA
jgi:flagellar biosynthetic protein FlhB